MRNPSLEPAIFYSHAARPGQVVPPTSKVLQRPAESVIAVARGSDPSTHTSGVNVTTAPASGAPSNRTLHEVRTEPLLDAAYNSARALSSSTDNLLSPLVSIIG